MRAKKNTEYKLKHDHHCCATIFNDVIEIFVANQFRLNTYKFNNLYNIIQFLHADSI